jgi:hypothetical protein
LTGQLGIALLRTVPTSTRQKKLSSDLFVTECRFRVIGLDAGIPARLSLLPEIARELVKTAGDRLQVADAAFG